MTISIKQLRKKYDDKNPLIIQKVFKWILILVIITVHLSAGWKTATQVHVRQLLFDLKGHQQLLGKHIDHGGLCKNFLSHTLSLTEDLYLQIVNHHDSEETAMLLCFVFLLDLFFVLSKNRIHCDICRKLKQFGESPITLCSLSTFLLFELSTVSSKSRPFKGLFCHLLHHQIIFILGSEA